MDTEPLQPPAGLLVLADEQPTENTASPPEQVAVRPLAVFDLDGTLVRGDSFLPFLLTYAWRHARIWPVATLPIYVGLYVCRLLSDRSAKSRVLVSFLKGRCRAEVAAHAEWFCSWWVRRKLSPEVVEKLREHQAAGHRVILLSASPDPYVPAVGSFLGIEEVICTRVSTNETQWGGEIVGSNCKGSGKIEMLQAHLQGDEAAPESYAYGDSRSDLPLLQWVSHGFLVKRGRFLRV